MALHCKQVKLSKNKYVIAVAPFSVEMSVFLQLTYTRLCVTSYNNIQEKHSKDAQTHFVCGLAQHFPKHSGSSKALPRKSPKGISVVHQCPSFHSVSCTLSVCSSWSLFFPFLKVTSTAVARVSASELSFQAMCNMLLLIT